MNMEIVTKGFTLTDALWSYTSKRFETPLVRASANIQRVRVRLSDVNGPKGGPDKRCAVIVSRVRLPSIVIEETRANLYEAIDCAANRLATTISRKKERGLRHAPIPNDQSD